MTDTLDQKERHIAAKLPLCPGRRVLDMGSGCGGPGLHLAQSSSVSVTGLTLWAEKPGYAYKSAPDAGQHYAHTHEEMARPVDRRTRLY